MKKEIITETRKNLKSVKALLNRKARKEFKEDGCASNDTLCQLSIINNALLVLKELEIK